MASPDTIDSMISFVMAHEHRLVSIAEEKNIDALTLRTRLLLHLPRLLKEGDQVTLDQMSTEAQRVSEHIARLQRPYTSWLKSPGSEITLDDLEFIHLDAERARAFHEAFHYIGSFRLGENFALVLRGTDKVVCMGSMSEFDFVHSHEEIAPYLPMDRVMVATRFFAFRWAPQNSFSFFWAKVSEYFEKECGVELFLSFINPNLGFSGASHKGAPWQLFATEDGVEYMYLDGEYVTMRYLVKTYGTNDFAELKKHLGNSLQVSMLIMHPILLFANPMTKRARNAIPAKPYLFFRPRITSLAIDQAVSDSN
jgi:hypothetical protein